MDQNVHSLSYQHAKDYTYKTKHLSVTSGSKQELQPSLVTTVLLGLLQIALERCYYMLQLNFKVIAHARIRAPGWDSLITTFQEIITIFQVKSEVCKLFWTLWIHFSDVLLHGKCQLLSKPSFNSEMVVRTPLHSLMQFFKPFLNLVLVQPRNNVDCRNQ